ncbi:MAG: amidohydrolase [Candidatus Tectomicrobia bacterium]|nr:amidohydrolase [Candidatus Tectomicrobia bacterium]
MAVLDLAPDLILYNGKIITVDREFSIAEAVAIKNGLFIGVGRSDELLSLAGRQTQTIDLNGKAVIPGLIDAHAHMDREGLKSAYPSLEGCRSIGDIQRIIAREVARTRPGEWIVTMPVGDPPYYFDVPSNLAEQRFPNRWDLDAVSPDNPVYIRSIWGYWRHTLPLVSAANSQALRLAGITRETLPPYGGIQIDKDMRTGEPTGVFYEWNLVPSVEFSLMKAVPRFTHEHRVQGLRESLARYHAFGTTSIYEEHGIAPEVIQAYKELWQRGELTMRSHLVLSPPWGTISQIEREEVVRDFFSYADGQGLGDGWLKIGGIAIQEVTTVDRIRSQERPYTGWAGHRSDAALPKEEVLPLLVAAAQHRLQVTCMRASLLDLYEQANVQAPIGDLRWVVGHISIVTEEQVKRMRRLGILVSTHTNRYIWKEGAILLKQVGRSCENDIVPLRRLFDAGIPVSFGTDNVPCSMFYPIWQVVARRDRYSGEVIAPEQRLTREEALKAATIYGAYLSGEERMKGSVELGKWADLALLSADPLVCPEDELREIVSLMTIVGGKVVYQK